MRPREIIVEKDCLDFPLAKRLRRKFLNSKSTVYREVNAQGKGLPPATENASTILQMKSTLVVTQTEGFYIDKAGEGTGNPACDYDIEFIWGCPHRCAFCQQIYFLPRRPYIEIYPDLDRILQQVARIVQKAEKLPVVFEAGGMTDLLALEPITGILKEMILFWANELSCQSRLQFLTRSSNVQRILGLNHKGMTRVGFSVNLAEFVQGYELGSASLAQRLQAVKSVLADGYSLHLSLSPIIYREEILPKYEQFFEEIKAFLLGCEGFNESNLTIEALIFFQKKGGEYQIRRYYPWVAEELLQYCEYRRFGSGERYCYPQYIYDKLLPFLKDCFVRYFPKAMVSFIA